MEDKRKGGDEIKCLSRLFLTTSRRSPRNGGPSFPDAVRPINKSVSSQMDRGHLQLERKNRESAQTRGRERECYKLRHGTRPSKQESLARMAHTYELTRVFSTVRILEQESLSSSKSLYLWPSQHTFDLDLTLLVAVLEPRVPWHSRVLPKVRSAEMASNQAHGNKRFPGRRQLHLWVQPKVDRTLQVCPVVGEPCGVQPCLTEHKHPSWWPGVLPVRSPRTPGRAYGRCSRAWCCNSVKRQ